MQIIKQNNTFLFRFQYDPVLVEAVKNLSGRVYDPQTKTWTVPASPAIVPDIINFAEMYNFELDPEIRKMKVNQEVKFKAPKNMKLVTNATIPPWDHQKRMVAYAQELPAVLWHCGMGTGKTRAAIDLIQTEKIPATLIICPLAILPAWEKQFRMFAQIPVNVVALGGRYSVARKRELAEFNLNLAKARKEPCVLIVNYESAWRDPFGSWALKQTWPLVILDEGHNIKSPGGKASRFCAKLGKQAIKRLALTGTPLPHSPLDAYGLYRFLDPAIFGLSFFRFKLKYAVMGGYQGKQVISYQNTGEFKEKLDLIRIHVSRDILDLPDAVHTEVPCTLNPKAQKIYETLENEFYAMVDAGEITVNNALTKLLRLQQITSGYIPTDEGDTHNLHSGKADALESLFASLEQNEPIVVFCRFTHDINKVQEIAAKTGRKCLELSGGKKELEEWQSGKAPVLAAQIQTAKEGVDMTRACYCVYYSLGFSLSDYEQSLARTHRPGQKRTVFYYHLVTEETVDRRVYTALKQRKNVIESIISK